MLYKQIGVVYCYRNYWNNAKRSNKYKPIKPNQQESKKVSDLLDHFLSKAKTQGLAAGQWTEVFKGQASNGLVQSSAVQQGQKPEHRPHAGKFPKHKYRSAERYHRYLAVQQKQLEQNKQRELKKQTAQSKRLAKKLAKQQEQLQLQQQLQQQAHKKPQLRKSFQDNSVNRDLPEYGKRTEEQILWMQAKGRALRRAAIAAAIARAKAGVQAVTQAVSCYIEETGGNVFVRLVDSGGRLLAQITAGCLQLTGPKKGTGYALRSCVWAITARILGFRLTAVKVYILGQVTKVVRSTLWILAKGGVRILAVGQRRKTAHNGVRLSKARRK